MPRCTHCGHEFAVSQDFRCPACEQDWRGPADAARPAAAGAGAPAHLAVLEQGGVAPPEPKPRIVSTAGPAMPVLQNKNDSVPPGWMARLEAARMVAKTTGGETTGAPPDPIPAPAKASPPAAPPPLPSKRKKGARGLESKPAHLLVAQLEADERRRRADEQAKLTELFTDEASGKESSPSSAIAEVQVDLPTAAPKKRQVSDWVIVALLGALVVSGIAYAYTSAQEAPAPKAEVDPALEEAKARREKAIAALERGHQLALDGKKGADGAIAAYKEALALEPDLASAERGIAIAYAAKDDDASAVKHYQRYLDLAPDAKDASKVKRIIARWKKAQKRR